MRRGVAILALVLVVMGAVAPLAEALTGCLPGCPDDDVAGRCGDASCCGCCVYAAPATIPPPTRAATASLSTPLVGEPRNALPSVDPRDLFQVPKAGRL
jgi:hypothetical protein